MFTRKSGLPPVFRCSTRASSEGTGAPGKRRARYSPTAASLRNSRASPRNTRAPAAPASPAQADAPCPRRRRADTWRGPAGARFAAAREHREQVDRGRVAPVEVLQQQHERRLERSGRRAPPPAPAASARASRPRRGAAPPRGRGRQQRRQLRQPGRRVLPEDIERAARRPPRVRAARALRARADRPRPLRTARRIARGRSAARPPPAELREERFDERRLADARLARDEDEGRCPPSAVAKSAWSRASSASRPTSCGAPGLGRPGEHGRRLGDAPRASERPMKRKPRRCTVSR